MSKEHEIIKVLTVIPHLRLSFGDFAKATSKYVSNEFMVPYNPLFEIAKYVPIHGIFDTLRSYYIKDQLCPPNISSELNVNCFSFLFFRRQSKDYSFGDKLVKRILKVLGKKIKTYNVIHGHFTWPCGYAAVKLGEKYGIPSVVTAHGYDVYDLPFRDERWKKIITWTLEHAQSIITVSNLNKLIMVKKLGISSNKIKVIPNGYDSKKFKVMDRTYCRKMLKLPLDVKILLNVGALFPIKGQIYLIDAMRQLIKIYPKTKLFIVGEGPIRDELEKRIKNLSLEEYVKIVGYAPHHEIPLWMNAADLFVLPSLSEGNPTVMFETLGVGLPFVGTAVGGVPEIITSEDYGLLCPPKDPECLAEKILIALEKEWDREKIIKYAQQFTWENIAEKILDVYLSVMQIQDKQSNNSKH